MTMLGTTVAMAMMIAMVRLAGVHVTWQSLGVHDDLGEPGLTFAMVRVTGVR